MKAEKRKIPALNIVSMSELRDAYKNTQEATYIQLYKSEETLQKCLRNGLTASFDKDGITRSDRLEVLINLLRQEEDVYIYIEYAEGVSTQLKSAIERYHSVVHGYRYKDANRTKSSMKKSRVIYDKILTMHKRVTDIQYKNVKKWIEERDTFKYTSLTHLVTLLDYKANEHNYIVRGMSSEIRSLFNGIGLLNYQMRTVSMWEADKFELPIISAFSFSKMLNHVKRPASDALSPIFALN